MLSVETKSMFKFSLKVKKDILYCFNGISCGKWCRFIQVLMIYKRLKIGLNYKFHPFVFFLYLLLFHSHDLQVFSGRLDNILPGL